MQGAHDDVVDLYRPAYGPRLRRVLDQLTADLSERCDYVDASVKRIHMITSKRKHVTQAQALVARRADVAQRRRSHDVYPACAFGLGLRGQPLG